MVSIDNFLLTMLEVTVLLLTALLVVSQITFKFYDSGGNENTINAIGWSILGFILSIMFIVFYMIVRVWEQFEWQTAAPLTVILLCFGGGTLALGGSISHLTTDIREDIMSVEPSLFSYKYKEK